MTKEFFRATLIASLSIPLLIFQNTMEVQASTFGDSEEAIAGISVVLNSYYAQTEKPVEELSPYLAPLDISPVESASPEASPYKDIAISRVNNYVNIRDTASTGGEILGKLYNNCAATILDTVAGEDGTWYHIKSGSVEGFIKSEYFVTGDEAENIAKEVGTVVAKVVNTPTLRLREEADLESTTLTLLAEDAEYIVVAEDVEGFAKIAIDNDLEGYVSTDYVEIRVDFDSAVSIEEEKAKKEEEDRRKKEAEEAIRKADEAKKAAAAKTEAKSSSSGTSSVNPTGEAPAVSTEVTSATRSAVVAYAMQFLGNPYVYGGTSLTNGADCSGFTSSIYKNFGLSIGRSSRDQAAKGRAISLDAVQPGDLLFYESGGTINHVALAIGNGQVIHSSTPKTGIVISNMYYRTPCKAVSVLD